MIRNMVTSALVAGVAAWLLAALLHFAFVQKFILLGESYESGAAVHFAGVTPSAGHDDTGSHDEAATEAAEGHDEAPAATEAEGAASQDKAAEPSTFTRNLWTVVFFGLVYMAYALMLAAGFGLARTYGREITAREGLLWGLAGFAAFQLAPAMGLAPNLPGTPGADVVDRQIWWWATALATATGLGLLAYGRGGIAVVVAVALVAAPHVIGAPQAEGYGGVAPPEVAAAFAARVLGVSLAAWAILGWVAGHVWSRGDDKPA